MKKIIFILASLAIFSCNKDAKNAYHITGNLTGFEEGEMVYVNKVSDANRAIIIDSTKINNGKFEIDLPNVETKDFNYLTFEKSSKGNILLIAENSLITITADVSNLRAAKIEGGEENIIFSDFLNKISAQADVQASITEQTNEAKSTGDYTAFKEIKRRSDSLQEAQKEMRFRMVKEHPKTVTGIMALSDLVSFKTISVAEAKGFYDNLPLELKESRLGINLNTSINSIVEIKNQIGDKVIDFTAPSLSGEKFNLKSNLGKITILDFWASWCRPCRLENPNVVRVYNKYKDKGLEIIGISFDQSKEKWQNAVDKDGLIWKHVSNLKGWKEPLGKPFGVRSIPATFLLDEKGVIIAKNLRGQALENKIAELLN